MLDFFQIILYIALIFFSIKGINKLVDRGESHIGEEYIIRGDTLIITDYSILGRNYTLSNGAKVYYKLIENEK